MIVVAGTLTIAAGRRDEFLGRCRPVVAAARSARGCLDFRQDADLLEPDRVNVYEAWESVDAVEAFRGDGPGADLADAIVDANVHQYEIASDTPL